MNRIVGVRMTSWKTTVQERSASSLSTKEWCAASNVSKSQYYYHLGQLHNTTLAAAGQMSAEDTGGFMRVPFRPTDSPSGVVLRIRRVDTITEVSGDMPDNILVFPKVAMTDAI